ncbi:MAG: hypothetical protein KC897_04160 [Candidatus Omnitrophica bacterium]|nr:hypothetical protein [Candidatus Omnitrophota bacterium]MCB9721880.1 hypothetical protein [Candidatus Omnitrophota bacterium]
MKNITGTVVSICLMVSVTARPLPAHAGLWGDFVSSITGSDDAGEAVDGTIDATNEAVAEGMENAEERLNQTSEMMGEVTGAVNEMREGVVDNMGGETAAEEARRQKEYQAKIKDSQKLEQEENNAAREAAMKQRQENNTAVIISTQMNSKSSTSGKERTNFNNADKKANDNTDAIRKAKAPSTSGKTKTGDLPKREKKTIDTKRK